MPIWAFIAAGIASFYDMPGARMADGNRFDSHAHVCAMLSEPFGERVEILNRENHRRSWCIVEDRGPFVIGRIIDVSPAVRDELGFDGLSEVVVYRQIGRVPNCKLFPLPATCKVPPPNLCVLNLPKPVLVKCDGRS